MNDQTATEDSYPTPPEDAYPLPDEVPVPVPVPVPATVVTATIETLQLAVAIARAVVDAGHRVYFTTTTTTTAADLAARCHKAALEGRWATRMRFFAGPNSS
jgi:hypothetical protein